MHRVAHAIGLPNVHVARRGIHSYFVTVATMKCTSAELSRVLEMAVMILARLIKHRAACELRSCARLAILSVLGLLPGLVFAQPAPWPAAPRVMRMISISDLRQSTLEPQVGNGRVEKTRDWPASFVSKSDIGQDSESCTSTLVGSESLLTAAHCIADGGRVEITSHGHSYSGICERPHPGYPVLMSADWAL